VKKHRVNQANKTRSGNTPTEKLQREKPRNQNHRLNGLTSQVELIALGQQKPSNK